MIAANIDHPQAAALLVDPAMLRSGVLDTYRRGRHSGQPCLADLPAFSRSR